MTASTRIIAPTRIGTALAVAALTAAGAAAQPIEKVGEAAGWEIAVNANMGPGCLVTKTVDHLQVQLGINALAAEKTGYMAVFTRADVPVAQGEVVPVAFEVGGKSYEGVAFGERMEGFHGAWVPVNNPEFVYELAKQETMSIAVADLAPVEVSLAGTDAAFQAMRECQEAQ